MPHNPILLGIPEIAEIAGVTRSAVSNWRKRHSDFPEPRVQTDSGVLFDIASIEEWLLARGKLAGPVSPGALVWRFGDALRGEWSAEQFATFVSSWLVYLEACDRAAQLESGGYLREGVAVEIPPQHRWESVQHARNGDLPDRVRRAAGYIQEHNPVVDGLFDGLAPDPFPDAGLLRAFIAQLEGAAATEGSRVSLFEEAQQRVHSLDRFAGGFDTPTDVGRLMSRLAGSIAGSATVVDPAVGTGGLLLAWAVGETRPSVLVDLVGVEVSEAVARHARALFFIHGLEARIRSADALRLDPAEWPSVDLVLLDSPMGVSHWGDAALYRDKRWVYGVPPAGNADLAWVQLCVSMLKPTGRAVVSLPVGSLTRGGVEAEIRQALINAGVVEAIVELPARLRSDTSIPIALWLLRAPAEDASESEVLLVDASRLGISGRSAHELSSDDIDRIVQLVERSRDEDLNPDEEQLSDLTCITLAPWDVKDGQLSPRRYWAPGSPDLPSLRDAADELRLDLHTRFEHFVAAVDALLSQDAPREHEIAGTCAHGLSSPMWCTECRKQQRASVRVEELDATELDELLATDAPTSVTPRIELGELAHVFACTAGTEHGADDIQQGDVVITTSTGGFVVSSCDEAGIEHERPRGRILVIRPRRDQAVVAPEWLRVWAASSEFQELLGQHARGSTVRSVSVSAVAGFLVPVPTAESQRAAAELRERVEAAAATATAVARTMTELRRVEIDRAFAEATQP